MDYRARLILAVFAAAFLSGCASLNPFSAIQSPPQEPRKVASWAQSETVEPLIVGKVDGRAVVANRVERTYSAGYEQVSPRLTLGQRIGRFFGGLTLWGLAFIAVSLAFFGGAPIVWVWARYLKMRRALANTSEAIERMNKSDYEKLRPLLLQEQDEADRKTIKRMKISGSIKPSGPPPSEQ